MELVVHCTASYFHYSVAIAQCQFIAVCCTFSMFFADTKMRQPQTAHKDGGRGREDIASLEVALSIFIPNTIALFISLLFCVDILLLFQTASTNFMFVFKCFNDTTQASLYHFISQPSSSRSWLSVQATYTVLRCIPYLFPLGHIGP